MSDVAVAVGETAVYGIDLAGGQQVWRVPREGGSLAIPAVGDSADGPVLVFTEGSDDDGSALVAVGLDSMSELWRVPLEAPSRSGVTIDGQSAFVGDREGNLYGVDLSSGELLWSASAAGQIPSPPSAADGNVYAVGLDADEGQTEVLAVDGATGEALWSYSPTSAGSTASGSAAADGTVIAGFADRQVRAFGAEGGGERWDALLNSVPFPFAAPALAGDDVFVTDVSGGLYRLSSATGERIWGYQLNELAVRSSPVVSGDAAVIGLNDGRLVAIGVDSGHLVWQSPPDEGLIGVLALAPDRLVAVKGGKTPGLVAYEHDPDGVLVDVPSPTQLDAARILSRFGVAAVILLVAVLAPALLLRRRLGPLELPQAPEEAPGEDERS